MAKKFKEMPGWLTGKKEEVPYWKQQLEEDFAAKREARAELFRQQREEFSNQHTYDHEGGTKIIPTQPASTTTSKPAPTSGAGQSYSTPSYSQYVDNIAGGMVTPVSPTADKFANKFKANMPGQCFR
jgi:hypothetical protein